MFYTFKLFVLLVLICSTSNAQEGISVYADYLSDNYYLLHPSMAGASNCTKVRFTARAQWLNEAEAPSMQTLSINGRITDKAGAGMVVYNDKNGYHSQKGVKFTYAYHLLFSRDQVDLNQLSFGISAGLVQSQLDETEFIRSGDYDPIVDGTIVQKDSYFNTDVGLSYNFLDFYVHATVKNAIETRRELYSGYETDNLRKYLFSTGYIFGNSDRVLLEPSILFQYTEKTKEKTIDLNVKAYKNMDFGKVWAGLSYRRQLDAAVNSPQKLQSFTPILGLNYNNYMFSYTYSQLSGAELYSNGGYHQLTLGIDLFCKKERYNCNCPAIN